MDAEKIFWVLAVALAGGFFLFLTFGPRVSPLSAAQPQPSGWQFPVQQAGAAGAQPAAQPSGGQLAGQKGGVQEVTLTVQGGSYMPNPVRVKKGVPVRLVADLGSVRGCASSIVIPEFGVRKTFRQGDNAVEFTPTKSGTFDFGCSMWMYRGKIVVEETDGSVAAFTGNAPPVKAGSCGSSGGGCGCGG